MNMAKNTLNKKIKCGKCRHYYRKMVGANGQGYNPAPCCWCYEDTGRRPTILTQECFEPRPRVPKPSTKPKADPVAVAT